MLRALRSHAQVWARGFASLMLVAVLLTSFGHGCGSQTGEHQGETAHISAAHALLGDADGGSEHRCPACLLQHSLIALLPDAPSEWAKPAQTGFESPDSPVQSPRKWSRSLSARGPPHA